MRLGVLLRHREFGNAAQQDQRPTFQIDIRPPDRPQFASACTCRHGDPDERAPGRVFVPRGLEDARSFRRRRRVRVRSGWRGRLRRMDGIGCDPPPPDSPIQRSGQDPVDLTDRAGTERLADVRPASLVAVVGKPSSGGRPAWTSAAESTGSGTAEAAHRSGQESRHRDRRPSVSLGPVG
jgi:hypothetical protein